MARKRFNSRVLRELAEEIIEGFAQENHISESEKADLATSLVRQWITYDGNASLYLGECQIYLPLSKSPLGEPCVVPEANPPGWFRRVFRDWNLLPEQLPEIVAQLNIGQSAEVTNQEGVALRLWVNPKERKNAIEPVDPKGPVAKTKRDYRKIAGDVLQQQLGLSMRSDELEALTTSVVRQWRDYQGHAALFLEDFQLLIRFTEFAAGNCNVEAERVSTNIESFLLSIGIDADLIPEVLSRINLGQPVEFEAENGIPSRLCHDPKARQIYVRPINQARPQLSRMTPEIFCPRCSAVLPPWPAGSQQQFCPQCGDSVSRF